MSTNINSVGLIIKYFMNQNKKQISILGLTHMGLVYAAGFSSLGYQVAAYDRSNKLINKLKIKQCPIFEPNLEELLFSKSNPVAFFSDIAPAIKLSDYIFVTLDLPVNNQDRVDLSPLDWIVKSLTGKISKNSVLVICSQIPVGTCQKIQRKLSKNENIKVICFPENLRLGTAMENFLKPDRWVLGANDTKTINEFKSYFKDIKTNISTMNLESAEMTKHATNIYLAMNISFSSEIGDICEQTGADLRDVVKALKTDSRVSLKAPLNPGIGFAGGTLGRDIRSLESVSKTLKYKPKLIRAIYSVNQDRIDHLIGRLQKVLKKFKGKKIGILGLSYKPNSDSIRRSISIELASVLIEKGCSVRAFDPKVKSTKVNNLKIVSKVGFPTGLDAIILMTPWPEFERYLTKKFKSKMTTPNLFDVKNFLSQSKMIKVGFNYYGSGF